MINSVRNTVLSVLNKNNYGFMTPTDFNLYAKQAQMDIFEDYFFKHNEQIMKQNRRITGSGTADIAKGYEEVIDRFTLDQYLESIEDQPEEKTNKYALPENFYRLQRLWYTPQGDRTVEIERVSNYSAMDLYMSNLTQPIELFPVYTQKGTEITVHPSSIANDNLVLCTYIRYPKDPKWTFRVLSGNAPLFDQTQPDYQDFELPPHDEPRLVVKILQYAGVNIREGDVVSFSNQEEQKDMQLNR